jgi:hypothetical protein
VIRSYVGDRRSGKTTELIWWMYHGQKMPGTYPGWSRVIVTPSVQMAQVTKRMAAKLRSDKEWGDLDLSHRIYSLHEWETAHGVHPDVKVALDNMEFMLPRLPGRLSMVSMTGMAYHLPDTNT